MLSNRQQNKSPAPVSNDRFVAINKKLIAQMVVVGFVLLVTIVLLFAMTTAWFTNVVHTQGMMFQAEAWGFDGSVTLPQEAILAMPGDSGVIAMNVTNNSEEASNLTVNITKEYMQIQELQNRIYFYADETATVNGEQVQRQYLSNIGGYSYIVNGKNALMLSDTVCTDVPLRWQWVYDVVGYYYTGTEANGVITATEYLRPVEYDYFEAHYDDQGGLTMVDAETTAAEFLQTLTQTDGYPGYFRAKDMGGGKMILVDAQDNEIQRQNGSYCIQPATETEPAVWLYLCSLEEIEANTVWDTGFINREVQDRAFDVRITLTGVQMQQQMAGVSDPAVLADALNNGDQTVVQLQNNMTLTKGIELAENVNVTLDLNGYTLDYTGTAPAFQVESGSKLTVTNGTLKGNNANVGFHSIGGQLTMSDVTVTDMFVALQINDYLTENEHGANSVVRILDSNLKTHDDTIEICGDGVASAGKTMLIIENSNIESQTYVGILGKGNSTKPSQWGTDIQIINSTVTGYYAGIYHPMQQSKLTISNDSVISGLTGIAMKGGHLAVIDSTVSGTGVTGVVDMSANPTLSGSGWLDSGDGIYIETDYNYPITVSVSGNSMITCEAATAKAVRVYPEAEHVIVKLSGGIYSTDVSAYVEEGCSCQSGTDGYEVK